MRVKSKPQTERAQPPIFDMDETVHVADSTGVRCGDCGTVISAPTAKPFYPYEHVVLIGRDPCSGWRTTRPLTCKPARTPARIQ
jgi:hypothetical protein